MMFMQKENALSCLLEFSLSASGLGRLTCFHLFLILISGTGLSLKWNWQIFWGTACSWSKEN